MKIYIITPDPYTEDADYFITDDKNQAIDVLELAAESAWASLTEDGKRILSIERKDATLEEIQIIEELKELGA